MNDFASFRPKRPASEDGPPSNGPTADEGLQLIQAFLEIADSERRAQVIKLAQSFSAQQPQRTH